MDDYGYEEYTVRFSTDHGGMGKNYSREEWFNWQGKRQAPNGAAVIVKEILTGKVVRQEWRLDDKLHRYGDEPAIIQVFEDSTERCWYDHGKPHRDLNPAVEKISNTGVILKEEWYEMGKRHKKNSPAVVVREPVSGAIIREEWWLEGELHRDSDEPAITQVFEDSIERRWYREGGPHRDSGPAVEQISDNGIVISEEWYTFGKRHKNDGPAITLRDFETGEITHEFYYNNGLLHREDGPARFSKDAITGVVTGITYSLWGKMHRLDGPAEIERDPDTGEIEIEAYYENGIERPYPGPSPKEP